MQGRRRRPARQAGRRRPVWRPLMSAVTATRTELLQRRAQTAFAEQGRDLIMDKRTALMREFAALRRDLLTELSELGELAVRARETLSAAIATDGHVAVRSAALGSADGIRVALMSRTVAGVPIFELTRSPVRHDPRHRGWASVVVSMRVDAVAEAYEEYLERLLDLCALELTVRGLASEIARATRQVNALENVVLPRIAAESASIARVLDEREREERGRLQRAKSRRGSAPVDADPHAPDVHDSDPAHADLRGDTP